MSASADVKNLEAGLAGGMMGAFGALQENHKVKDQIRERNYRELREEIDKLKNSGPGGSTPGLLLPAVIDFLQGLGFARFRPIDGQWTPTGRPLPFSASDVVNLSYPPAPTVRDDKGIVVALGQSYKLGQLFGLPEVTAALAGLALPSAPTPAQLSQVFAAWSAFQAAASQTAVVPALSSAQLAALATQIASSPLAQASLQNLFQGMCSQAIQAFNVAMAATGPLNAAQVQLIVNYFNNLVTSIIAAGGASAVSAAWNAAASPALADPALDTAWPNTYLPSSLSGTPASTTAGNLGAIVLGAQATAAVFKYIASAQEQQTTRLFRLQITPTTTAGTMVRCFLPAPLKNQNAPKVRVQVEGIGVVAAPPLCFSHEGR